jgi:hypothetical protein
MFGISRATVYNLWQGRHYPLDGLSIDGPTTVPAGRSGGAS